MQRSVSHDSLSRLLQQSFAASSSAYKTSPYVPIDLSHGMFDDERRHIKVPYKPAAGLSWGEVRTDKPWTSLPPNQIDSRCEAMRHAERVRKLKDRRRGVSEAANVIPEASRFALQSKLPPAHDMLYRRSAAPIAASMLRSHQAGLYSMYLR